MSRIETAFANKAKIAYLTAGDGDPLYFLALARAGANILEIGMPFSDPVADGPAIQLAMERSLKNGTNIDKVLDIVRQIRSESDAAIILFTYYNPIQNNLEQFLNNAKQAGADGVLVVDLPFEEGAELRFLCNKIGLAQIAVAAPSTSPERIELLSRCGSGFLYYACRKGTTGVRDELPDDMVERIKVVRKHSKLPVAVGFGVSNHSMVEKILQVADGCVIGSYFVNIVAKNATPNELQQLAKEVFYVS
jgi:tryptophan synthase alpha chain